MCDRPVLSTEINLSDCLSCAGCVSVDEEEDKSHLQGIDLIKAGGANIIITPQAKMALYSTGRKGSFRLFEHSLVKYFGALGNTVVDSTVGTRILLEREKALLKRQGTVISTICPGTVLYLQNALEGIDPQLSHNLSPVEIAAKYAREISPKKCVSIVMCKDKRVEAKNNTHIDYCITAKEMQESLLGQEEIHGGAGKEPPPTENSTPWEPSRQDYTEFEYMHSVSRILEGSTTGGVFEGISAHLLCEAGPQEGRLVTVKSMKTHNEKAILPGGKKVLQLFGSSRIIAFTSKLKKDKSVLEQYAYIEMSMCTGGCLYGPSQGTAVDASLYAAVQQDKVSQESVEYPAASPGEERTFAAYKKKKRRNYLVEW
ncbi:uncharacterized protein NEMAJ01_1459 [Nematocida major]|uniref:uncharacterized protein n=1 Tax=Nematocida major TaxID=1912982 RepID=UPI0020081D7C|nr:uncharacterized protein NEMAJ01_1459 [Nematocida major]KAH9386563.1 hypothetical protein NEMAJ01_1459 [Nematocida major]